MHFPKELKIPARFYSLDLLRGMAALIVVLWHWQHFYMLNGGGFTPGFDVAREPYSPLFSIFYRHGWLAVDLFFCISGFIFYWLYGALVKQRLISPRDFFILRFSRLYPLHLLTLIAVLVGQHYFRQQQGTYFVYQTNDLYHFLLNLGLISAWISPQYSFNGPVWSISIETLLYLLFFLLCRFGSNRRWCLFIAAIVGLIVNYKIDPQIGRGIFSFFMGGICYISYEKAVNERRIWLCVRFFVPVTALFWSIFAIIYAAPFKSVNENLRNELGQLFCTSLLFPMTIVSLAVVETKRGQLGRRFRRIGDISYSTYLLHFPLQLGVAMWVAAAGLPLSFYDAPATMAAFFVLLIVVSVASHRYFEVPCQRALRKLIST